jgi:serine/threonine-protein kinase
VYKARQKGLDRLVALKILPDEVGHDVKFALRFTREARALARLNHPHIVSVFEFGSASGTYYFLMEYVDGSTLRDVILAKELPPQQALAIVPHLCDALQYAHDQGVVHRDIKPDNILLGKSGQVKIADFGLSRLLGGEGNEDVLTGTHQVMGTLRYMAPEQMEGAHHVDHRADIYSLGVVIYEMLTGELPIGRFAVPSQKAHIDVRLDEVVLRTLEKEPQLRYQRASDVKTDLESIVRTAGEYTMPVTELDVSGAKQDQDAKRTSLEKQELSARVLLLRRELMSRVENSLKPLFWGQILQMLIGIVFIALGVFCWAPNQDVPHRLVSGAILHAYGALMIISAGVTCTRIRRLDYSKSLDEVRDQLSRVRSHYLLSGALLGFSWWLLWIPLAVAVGFEAVMYPVAFWPSFGIGVIGLVASLALYAKILRSEKPGAEKIRRALAGESLSAADLALEEIANTEMI